MGWLWTTIGIITVGVLTNAIWELFLKPKGRQIYTALLNFRARRSSRYRADIYRQISKGDTNSIARGLFEEIGNVIICTFLLFYLWIVSMVVLRLFIAYPQLPLAGQSLKAYLAFTGPKSGSDILILFIFATAGVAYLFFTTVTFWLRNEYIHDAVAFYNQLRRTVAPAVHPDRLVDWDSLFTQIRSKEDLEAIIADMQEVAKAHNPNVRLEPYYFL